MADSAAADLLMECDEEEQQQEEEEEHKKVTAMMEMEEEEEGGSVPAPFRIIPIPTAPVLSCSPPTQTNTLTTAGCPRGFMVNGRLVPLLPGGGGAKLKLRSHPSGSASGFITVQVPVTLTLHSFAEPKNSNTSSSLTASTSEPEPEPTPIITGVISGEAAQKVLSEHNVNFITPNPRLKPSPPVKRQMMLSHTPAREQPLTSNKLPHRGQLDHVCPPDCPVCMSPFKLIPELRGFMCLCSPFIAESLKNLKRKKKPRWRTRDQKKKSGSKVTSPLQKIHRRSDDFLSEQLTNPAPPSSTFSPQRELCDPAPTTGKLVIMVEDFYYGSDAGQKPAKHNHLGSKYHGPYRCIHCPQMLRNNIQLMSHMQQHVSSMSQASLSSCPHCFRHFSSEFKLQCHLETVHSQYESTAKCRICELEFGSEPAFLWHMKSTHKPGEMPYICQVCDFRSSFYSDIWSHFEEAHSDTNLLLCQYCLRVLRNSSCYQQHFARHQRKTAFSCDKCRLHFLYVKERFQHKMWHHRTHIRPLQLKGLKPGTKVTVRTYSMVGGSEDAQAQKKTVSPCKVVDVESGPLPQETAKRKTVESLGTLLSHLSQDSELGVSHPSRCVECLTTVQDFSYHFPSLVRCSLCKFTTCCSTGYANHMINNHAACSNKPPYLSIFQSDYRLSDRLRCASCPFSTCRGDMMANHLTEQRDHRCIMSTHTAKTHTEGQISEALKQPAHSSDGVSSSGGGGGAFIPIYLLPSIQISPQLSVKPLTSPSPLSSPPAMTIKFLGPRPQDEQAAAPVSFFQLSVLLYALCNGLPQAASHFNTSPLTIRSWIEQRERGLSDRIWRWKTDKMATWVLSQREQQLRLSEQTLLQTAKRAMKKKSHPTEHYDWAIDFLLRHQLSLQPTGSKQHCSLPRDVRAHSHTFIRSLCSKMAGSSLPPRSIAFMDEFSVFINLEELSKQSPEALQLLGGPAEMPLLDVVLSGLSDGTFLTPLLFFRGIAADVPDGFPENVLLEARPDFTEQERLNIWIQKVWRPHLASLPDSRSLLMVDIHRGHLTEEFEGSMSACSTELIFIPAGCCCRLQPLHLCLSSVLKEFLQARWDQLVSEEGLDGLTVDQLVLTLSCWFSEVSSTLNDDTSILQRSFSLVCKEPQVVELQEETASMIHALTETLIQQLDTSNYPYTPPSPPLPPSPPTPPSNLPSPLAKQMELLLLLQKKREEEKMEAIYEEEKKKYREQWLLRSSSLRQVFEGDSDQESFPGLEETGDLDE